VRKGKIREKERENTEQRIANGKKDRGRKKNRGEETERGRGSGEGEIE